MKNLEDRIKFEKGKFYVWLTDNGTFEVYENQLTHAVRRGIIGFTGEQGLQRAIAEIERRIGG